jgi:hypothetical protein
MVGHAPALVASLQPSIIAMCKRFTPLAEVQFPFQQK